MGGVSFGVGIPSVRYRRYMTQVSGTLGRIRVGRRVSLTRGAIAVSNYRRYLGVTLARVRSLNFATSGTWGVPSCAGRNVFCLSLIASPLPFSVKVTSPGAMNENLCVIMAGSLRHTGVSHASHFI